MIEGNSLKLDKYVLKSQNRRKINWTYYKKIIVNV